MAAQRDRRRRAGARIGVVAGVAAAAAVLLVVLVFVLRDEDDEPDAVTPEAGMAHVHGLGINPADGALIVATHTGTFRIPPGKSQAERIGSSLQDTMGFTVVAVDHFLGSGHPDVAGMQQGQPGRLGLIESTDAGHSWKPLSLSGEADFHALVVAHNRVYGWDSTQGRFMVSADRSQWETRSVLDLVAFAVDPSDPEHVVATTASGLMDSVDGGRTWTRGGGPALGLVSWDAAAGLWGVDGAGAVWRFDGAWTAAGQMPGTPQAFLVHGEAQYAALHGADDQTLIYESSDSGQTWGIRAQGSRP